MLLYNFLKPYLEELECTWTATKEIPCFDLHFGDSKFSIRFALENKAIKMTLSVDETDNISRPATVFTSNLCTEIVFGTQEFTFDLKHEKDLVNYLHDRGIEELLKFNKKKADADFSGTFYHTIFDDKIYYVLSAENLKRILISETKYSKSLLYSLITFDDNQNDIPLLRTEKEHIKAFNSFQHYIETESTKGMRTLFMYNRLQNNVPHAKKSTTNRRKI